jgi:hypothetical protein
MQPDKCTVPRAGKDTPSAASEAELSTPARLLTHLCLKNLRPLGGFLENACHAGKDHLLQALGVSALAELRS